MSEEDKQRLKEYQGNYRETRRSRQFSIILLDCKYDK